MIDDDRYGWRAGVREDPVMCTLEVTIGLVAPDFVSYVTEINNTGAQRGGLVDRFAYPNPPQSLHMPMDMARALLDALAEHFGGIGTVRSLRSDYQHERKRVDKLIETVSKIATGEPR